MVRHFFMLLTELVSNECEASESSNLQLLVLLGEPLSNSSLLTLENEVAVELHLLTGDFGQMEWVKEHLK